MEKVIFVGINPQYDQYRSRKNCTRQRFNRWIDYMNLGFVSFANCIPTPGTYKASMIDYERLKLMVESYNKVVALGNFPSQALNKINKAHFKLPHPSPLNRLLNDKNYTKKILNKCKRYLTK